MRFFNRLRSKYYFEIYPKIINWIVSKSTKNAEKRIQAAAIGSLLVDNTVLAHSVTHETAWINTGNKPWGDTTVSTGYLARIPVHNETDFSESFRCIKYLPGIIDLAKRKIITLAVSDELHDERWTQPDGRFRGYGMCDLSLFFNTDFEVIKDPTYTWAIGPSYLGFKSMEEQRRDRLKHKPGQLYYDLLSVLGPKNSQDAWHIATAETAGCYCFLTMDFKLLRNIKAQSKNRVISSLRTKIMTPEQFGIEFNVMQIPPRLFSYHSSVCPVRDDLNWPDSKRRKRSINKDRT